MGVSVSGRPRRAQRRARREVVAGLLVFLVVQGAVAVLVEVWSPGWRVPLLTSRVEHFRDRLRQRPARTVLILGSSRVRFGVRVGPLERQLSEALAAPVAVFNYGVFGAGCLTSHRQWRRLRAAGARPDLVVVEVVPSLFHEGAPALDDAWRGVPAGEMDRDDIAEVLRRDPSRADLHRENLLARAFPLYGHRQAIVSRLAPHLQPPQYHRPPDYFVDLCEDVPDEKRPRALRQAFREHGATLAAFRVGAEHVRDAEELLADVRDAGATAVVLVMPEGPAFRSWYRPGAWEEFEAALRGLCSRGGAAFVSARDWLDEEAFSDSHHLRVAGAEHFSRRFGAEVLLPALRGSVVGGGRPQLSLGWAGGRDSAARSASAGSSAEGRAAARGR
jgi:hypothetical protein